MLEDIRSDTIATFLLQKSNLTEVQLDTILASEEIGSLDFKRGLREKHQGLERLLCADTQASP